MPTCSTNDPGFSARPAQIEPRAHGRLARIALQRGAHLFGDAPHQAGRAVDQGAVDGRVLGQDAAGQEISLRAGRFGPYVQLGEENPDTGEKPVYASLRKGQFIEYSLADKNMLANLTNMLATFCPVGSGLKKESAAKAKQNKTALPKAE